MPEHVMHPIPEDLTEMVRVYDSEEHFVGIYAYLTSEKLFKPMKMFL
jgi:hypothetical protein